MSELISRHQVIRDDEGNPLYYLIPAHEYENMGLDEDDAVVPLEVSKAVVLEGKSPIRAWREHLKLTQAEAAERLGMDQSSFARLEKAGVKSRRSTLEKVAQAFGVEAAQLDM